MKSVCSATPLQQWIADNVQITFLDDNDNINKKSVQDVRSDHHGSLLHMYSILAGHSPIQASEYLALGMLLHSLSFLLTHFCQHLRILLLCKEVLFLSVRSSLITSMDYQCCPNQFLNTFSSTIMGKNQR